MSPSLKSVFCPTPEVEKANTGLRYTDILFGFVIRELFIRLQNWGGLTDAVRLHLIVGTILVLGSWIGFRRSLHRPSYQLKFFNLALFRFLTDQLMLILYFRVAVLTPAPDSSGMPPAADALASSTIILIIFVFLLYLVWDILGIWMACAKTNGSDGNVGPLYPVVENNAMTGRAQKPNWPGFFITLGFLMLLLCCLEVARCLGPNLVFVGTAAILLLYRWAKEVRTTCI
jgi:hypothetical protein